MDIAANRKMEYIKEFFDNPLDLAFLDLFKSMYIAGIKFANDNPKFVRMMSHLLVTKGKIYEDFFGKNLKIAVDLYSTLIDRDKEMGRIKKDIDTEVFAQLVVDITTNISIKEVEINEGNFDFDNMIERVTHILKIFKQGVSNGE